jgi:2-methylisocitrate lyase-like PEP mutase family enzyme
MNTVKDWSVRPSRFSDGLTPTTIFPAVWDAISANAARTMGATHLFLSGAAFNNVHGYPDRGVLDITETTQVIREIHNSAGLPVMVDAEAGFGSLPRLARLVDELLRAGVTALLIEDQDETGQSKTYDIEKAGLGDPDELCERIDVIRTVAGHDMSILARTDYLPHMDFEESLARLRQYDQAGADWVTPVFVPSYADLKRAAEEFPGRTMALAASFPISGVMKYSPTWQEVQELGILGVTVSGEYRNMWVALQKTYGQAMGGQWADMFAERPEPRQLDIDMGVTRPGMDL